MELKYIVLTIIKILISVPGVILVKNETNVPLLIGGHIDNKNNNITNETSYHTDYDIYDDDGYFNIKENSTYQSDEESRVPSEEIPDPEKLVVSGYNLPENIFNKGKPFYLEKDPVTGVVNFNSKSSLEFDENEYDYVEDEPSPDIFDKSNIDRKDGSLYAHKPSDVNQLTPNFHDFLNLPVKYNPEKYVYPLISSSYANTKIQGNVVKQHNHKDYSGTTYKPTVSPTYYTTKHYSNVYKTTKFNDYESDFRPITKKPIPTSTRLTNLMNNQMNHPSFENVNVVKTKKPYEYTTQAFTTTTTTITMPTTTKWTTTTMKPTTTTKKVLSFFEQLFADFDEPETTTTTTTTTIRPSPPTLFSQKYPETTTVNKLQTDMPNAHSYFNSQPEDVNYDYDDYNNEYPITDNIAVENKPMKMEIVTPKVDNKIITEANSDKKLIKDDKVVAVDNRFTNVDNKVSSVDNKQEVKDKSKNKGPTANSEIKEQKPEDKVVVKAKPEVVNVKDELKPAKDITNPKEDFKNNEKEAKHKLKDDSKKPSDKKETLLVDDSYFSRPNKTKFETSTKATTTMKVTSLPLGENHITHNNRQPIIVTTTNLKEQLNNEKIPYTTYVKGSLPPSTSNVHIAPDQDVVSFVVGNHQNVDGGQHVETNFKEGAFDNNPFRPLYTEREKYADREIQQATYHNFHVENRVTFKPEISGSAVNIQPNKNTEASLSIGKPISSIKNKIPGQVVDDSLDNNDKVYIKGTKIVFPDDKLTTTYTPDLKVPPVIQTTKPYPKPLPSLPPSLMPNREVLKLNSKPMFHQLPSDLTPPNQNKKDIPMPSRTDRIRPPWDPRPGHFYSGRPEYARPPRPPLPPPPNSDVYKRLDNLPNILPQFRPNARISNGLYYYENVNKKPFVRQPLLERPSNKPIELMSDLQPPPLPKNVYNLRPPVEYDVKLRQNVQPVITNEQDIKVAKVPSEAEMTKKPPQPVEDQFEFYQTPPKVVVANRRKSDEISDVETLQMIQAKQTDNKKEEPDEEPTIVKANEEVQETSEKPLYVVYPVNSPPLKMDVIDNNKKEAVVIGTRAELPLPPSEINQFAYEQTPLLTAKDRHDAPVLKPHPKPAAFPIRSDFPYHIERPDPSILNPAVPEIPNNNNHIDTTETFVNDNIKFTSNNQWNSLDDAESRIISGSKINTQQSNQISATLKTFTDKPIAVAYTPTETQYKEYHDKFSMPNYAGSVIPEIRPGSTGDENSEFTVSAVMHTHPHLDLATQNMEFINKHKQQQQQQMLLHSDNHRSDNEHYTTHVPPQEFQAPFQASVNLDHQSMSQGWTVIREKNKTESSTTEPEVTTVPIATTSEFDIENFKPKLIGGFKPLYNFPEDEIKKDVEVNDRQE